MEYNFKMTKQRQLLLDYFNNVEGYKSAEEVFKIFPHIDLSTIYRSLELFYNEGILIRQAIDNINYYAYANKHHHHYFICLCCKKKIEITCSDILDDGKLNKKYNFKIVNHNLTLYGYCNDCLKLL